MISELLDLADILTPNESEFSALLLATRGTSVMVNSLAQLDDANNVDVSPVFPNPQFQQLEMDFGVIRLLTPGHRMFFSLLGPSSAASACFFAAWAFMYFLRSSIRLPMS